VDECKPLLDGRFEAWQVRVAVHYLVHVGDLYPCIDNIHFQISAARASSATAAAAAAVATPFPPAGSLSADVLAAFTYTLAGSSEEGMDTNEVINQLNLAGRYTTEVGRCTLILSKPILKRLELSA